MAKAGRKKKPVTAEQIKQVEQLASRGLYDKDIYPLIGMGKTKFYELLKEVPELSDAIERGRASGHAQVANKLFESAMAGNVSAQQYYLARRAGWNETQQFQALDNEGERSNWTVKFVNADVTLRDGSQEEDQD